MAMSSLLSPLSSTLQSSPLFPIRHPSLLTLTTKLRCPKAQERRRSTTAQSKGSNSADAPDRLISAVCYFYPFFDGIQYGKYVLTQFTPIQLLIQPLFPAIKVFKSFPFNGFLVFLTLYFVVVRNRNFSRYVRFNTMQAIVLDVLLIFPDLLERSFNPRDGLGLDFVMSLDSTVFLFLLVSLIYGSSSCLLGQVPRLPIVAEAADSFKAIQVASRLINVPFRRIILIFLEEDYGNRLMKCSSGQSRTDFVVDPQLKTWKELLHSVENSPCINRDIHPSHYGRICPIDMSEGINVGLIGSLAIHARIGQWGSLESPFYEISERSKKVRMLYLSPSRDEYYMVAAGNSLALNQGIKEEQVVPARYCQEFPTIVWEQVHLRSIFPFQYFSIGASLIPFIEHNDANRALMSSNMQRQVVPLSRSCLITHKLERLKCGNVKRIEAL